MSRRARILDLIEERGVLRTSIAVTLVISSLGCGMFSGSFSIVFDGVNR